MPVKLMRRIPLGDTRCSAGMVDLYDAGDGQVSELSAGGYGEDVGGVLVESAKTKSFLFAACNAWPVGFDWATVRCYPAWQRSLCRSLR